MIPWDKSEAFKAGPESSVFHNLNDVPDAQRNRLVTTAGLPRVVRQVSRHPERHLGIGD